jgi:ABC-type lipoprotein release transport system permease subunit
VLGLILSVLVKAGITGLTPLLVELEPKGMLIAGLVALFGSGFGALYPALRAANQDAVKALAYE